jgi:hypothetical protein
VCIGFVAPLLQIHIVDLAFYLSLDLASPVSLGSFNLMEESKDATKPTHSLNTRDIYILDILYRIGGERVSSLEDLDIINLTFAWIS